MMRIDDMAAHHPNLWDPACLVALVDVRFCHSHSSTWAMARSPWLGGDKFQHEHEALVT